jgi:hypothetical protein
MTEEELATIEMVLAEYDEDWEGRTLRALVAEVRRLRKILAEVMVPIEALSAAGEKAWELAPEVRGELMTARTLGRAALFEKAPAPRHDPQPPRALVP